MERGAARGTSRSARGVRRLTVSTKDTSAQELLEALVHRERLDIVVPETLGILERDPLASGGCFTGDLLRALLELPGAYWSRNASMHARFLSALRAGALARRSLPPDVRMEFWSPLDVRARGQHDVEPVRTHASS